MTNDELIQISLSYLMNVMYDEDISKYEMMEMFESVQKKIYKRFSGKKKKALLKNLEELKRMYLERYKVKM